MSSSHQMPDPPGRGLTSFDNLESAFFTNSQCPGLPSPALVRASNQNDRAHKSPPVHFPELGLLVKYGRNVTVEEAQCMWLVRETLGHLVCVPELYGWRVEADITFIYQELVDGVELDQVWDELDTPQKTKVITQLKTMVDALRTLQQSNDLEKRFIGSINRSNLNDHVFDFRPQTAPWGSVKDFHDYFSELPQVVVHLPPEKRFRDPYRDHLPDTSEIKFTHGDLHRGNILVSKSDPSHVVAIVDWAHAGWYPDYWEYCKACYTADYRREWRKVWIPKFITPFDDAIDVFFWYINAFGAV